MQYLVIDQRIDTHRSREPTRRVALAIEAASLRCLQVQPPDHEHDTDEHGPQERRGSGPKLEVEELCRGAQLRLDKRVSPPTFAIASPG
jgi:hypothetical protein